jgi:hypothetical protein
MNLTVGHEANLHGARPLTLKSEPDEDVVCRQSAPDLTSFVSGLLTWRPWQFGPAHGLATGAMVGAVNQAPLIFTVWFGADVQLMSLLAMVCQIYDALNAAPFARAPDIGQLNSRLFPLRTWGRRAPFGVVGSPLFALGVFMAWNGAGFLSPVGAACWFCVFKFILANGMTITYLASTSSVYEIYSDKAGRVPVFASRMLWTQVGCAAGMGLTTQLAMRTAPGSSDQDVTFLIVGMVQAVMLLPMLLCALFVMPTTPLKDRECIAGGLSVWTIANRACSRPTVRYVVAATFFLYGSMNVLGLITFFLMFACGVADVDELANAQIFLAFAHGIGRLSFLPIQSRISQRLHPPTAAAFGLALCAVLSCPLLICSAAFSSYLPAAAVFFVLAGGWGLAELALTTMLGWVIDSDQMERSRSEGKLQPREEGIFWCLYSFTQALAQLTGTFGLLLLSTHGFDAKLAQQGREQPREAVVCLVVYVVGAFTTLTLLAAVSLLLFPLKGKQLQELEDYSKTLAISSSLTPPDARQSSKESAASNKLNRTGWSGDNMTVIAVPSVGTSDTPPTEI